MAARAVEIAEIVNAAAESQIEAVITDDDADATI